MLNTTVFFFLLGHGDSKIVEGVILHLQSQETQQVYTRSTSCYFSQSAHHNAISRKTRDNYVAVLQWKCIVLFASLWKNRLRSGRTDPEDGITALDVIKDQSYNQDHGRRE